MLFIQGVSCFITKGLAYLNTVRFEIQGLSWMCCFLFHNRFGKGAEKIYSRTWKMSVRHERSDRSRGLARFTRHTAAAYLPDRPSSQ
eukprot:50556-Amphidinium_carterae.1